MVGMRQTAKVAIRYDDALLRQIIVIVSSKAFFVFREKSIHSKGVSTWLVRRAGRS